MKAFGSTPARRCSCARLARRPARLRSKAPSTKWRRPAAWIRLAFRLTNYAEVEPISGKPFSSKALRECYTQGAARFGWARRPLAPRQMRDDDGLLVGWGMGTATFPGADVPGRRPGRCCGATAAASWRSAPTTWGRAPGPRWRRSRPMGLGSTSSRSSSGPARRTCRMAASPAARPTPRPPAWRFTTPVPTRSRELADLATSDDRSPLFGAGNAGVIARDGRLFRRDDESRSESYADILARAGLAQIEGHGTSAADPAAQSTYAMHAHGAVFAEVKVDPDLGQIRVDPPGRRVRRRTDHQSTHGAQPALWRHDLGRVVRAARARRHGSRARAG